MTLFAEKAKYITADAAYFVMADPGMLVVRGVGLGDQADKELPWAGLTIETFANIGPLFNEPKRIETVKRRASRFRLARVMKKPPA